MSMVPADQMQRAHPLGDQRVLEARLHCGQRCDKPSETRADDDEIRHQQMSLLNCLDDYLGSHQIVFYLWHGNSDGKL